MSSLLDPVHDWAASGAMWLTGRPDGPPFVAPGTPASYVRAQLATLGVAWPGLLGQRAAFAGLERRGPWSCGGRFRVLPAMDGWVGVALARDSDLDLVPALVEAAVVAEPWEAVGAWVRRTTTAAAEERLHLLGLAGGVVVPSRPPEGRGPVVTSVLGERRVTGRPLVVDLTSLWAGPLCAHLLGRRGARVVKVESRARPDGLRRGSPAMFAALHDGHEQVVLDLAHDVDTLRALVAEADLVLEASRPRALRQLGLVAEDVVAAGTSWLSITARGRRSGSIGYGDDVAACAGLALRDGGDVLPVGDALADPIAGVTAAVAAADALASEEARLIDVSMLDAAAATVGPVPDHQVLLRDDEWWVETADGAAPVARPRP